MLTYRLGLDWSFDLEWFRAEDVLVLGMDRLFDTGGDACFRACSTSGDDGFDWDSIAEEGVVWRWDVEETERDATRGVLFKGAGETGLGDDTLGCCTSTRGGGVTKEEPVETMRPEKLRDFCLP